MFVVVFVVVLLTPTHHNARTHRYDCSVRSSGTVRLFCLCCTPHSGRGSLNYTSGRSQSQSQSLNLSLPNITLLWNIERSWKLGYGYWTEGQSSLNCNSPSNPPPPPHSLSLSLSPYLDMAGLLPGLTEMLRRIRRGGGSAMNLVTIQTSLTVT
jgi:hypothetical protein